MEPATYVCLGPWREKTHSLKVISTSWWKWKPAELTLIELSQELEALLQQKVDILTDGGLSPYLEQRIHAEAVPL